MNTEKAKPGDMVHITNPSLHNYGPILQAVEAPEFATLDPPDKTWIMVGNFHRWLRTSDYTIVCLAESVSSVDESLKRQVNENLRSVFL